MNRTMAFLLIFSVLFFSAGLVSQVDAETASIASVQAAETIAADAGGSFVAGSTAPALTGTQVALPVLEEATGTVLGHIVAEQAALVTTLEAAGMAEVATAVAAIEAGAVAGATAGVGIAAGTTTAAVAGAAATTALVLEGATGGTTTTHHH